MGLFAFEQARRKITAERLAAARAVEEPAAESAKDEKKPAAKPKKKAGEKNE